MKPHLFSLAPWPSPLRSPRRPTRPKQPNVVVILADDQGWGDLSVHGNTNLQHAEHRFAGPRRGAVRAVLRLPGLLADAGRVPHRPLPLRGRRVRASRPAASGSTSTRRPSPTRFKAAGYATAAFGKWHNGTQYPYHPNARGFDEYYGFCSGHWGDYFDPPLEHNGQTRARQGLHHRRPDRPRDGVHRDRTATGRSSATCRSTRRTRRCRCPTGSTRSFDGCRPEDAQPRPAAGRLRMHAGGAGDVREHRLERRPRADRSSTS